MSGPFNINRRVRVVDSISALSTTLGSFDGETIRLVSYYLGQKKGGGFFVWDASSTTAPDGVVTFSVTGSTTGRWIRSVSNTLTDHMAGSYGDLINDDSVPIQRCIDYFVNKGIGGIVKLVSPRLKISGVEILGDGIVIEGAGKKGTYILFDDTVIGTASAFSYGQPKSGSGTITPVSGCKLKGMTIDGNRAGGAIGSAVRTTAFDGFELNDVHTYDCANNYGFAIIGTGINPRKRLIVKNCSAFRCGADGLDIKAGSSQIVIDGFESGDHLDETAGDSVGLDIRGQYVSASNIIIYNCIEIGLRVRINAGEQDGDSDWETTQKPKINLYNVTAYGCRDNFDISSAVGGSVNIFGMTSRFATRFGMSTGGGGWVSVHGGTISENLVGISPSANALLSLIDVNLDENTQDGVAGNAKLLCIRNGSISSNGRYGVGQLNTAEDARWLFDNVLISGNVTNYAVTSVNALGIVRFVNVKNTAAISRGVQIATTSLANIEFSGGEIVGNALNIHSINTNTRFSNVFNVRTKSKGRNTFSVTSAAVVDIEVPSHNLSFTPDLQDIQLTLSAETNVSDYNIGFIRVSNVTSTGFTIQVKVDTPSVTPMATAAVNWFIETKSFI